MRTPFDFMPWSCKMANHIMQRLLTVYYSCCTHLQPRASPFHERWWLEQLQGVSVWTWLRLLALWGPVGLEGDCRGWGRTVVRFPGWWGRKTGREEWQVAKAGNTQSLVWSPGVHPAQVLKEAGWRDTKRGGWPMKERRHAETVQTILNLVFVLDRKLAAIVKWSGKNSQQSYPI